MIFRHSLQMALRERRWPHKRGIRATYFRLSAICRGNQKEQTSVFFSFSCRSRHVKGSKERY